MKVTVLHEQTFWLDQIQYTPSSNVSLDNSTVMFDSSNPTVQYSSGWTALDGIVNLTQTMGSTVTFDFFGVSLLWLGFVPSNFSLTPASAIYSIDGQSSIAFTVPGVSASDLNASLYNQVFFQTETLSRGQHELIVTYQGSSGTAPLALDAFVVQNATSSTATSALTSVHGPFSSDPWSNLPNPTSNQGSNPRLVGIIAGVVSGVVILVLLLLFYIVRCRGKAQKLKENSNLEPFFISPQNYIPPSFSSKFSQSRELADAPGTSIPAPPPVIGARTNPAIRNTETNRPLMQPSASGQGGDLGFLQHADSGVRVPNEFPPAYTTG